MVNHSASEHWEMKGEVKAMGMQDAQGLHGLREQAGRLLARLEKGREMSEQRAAETGQRDPMKSITGRSALDSAITATRGMIARMDALLSEFDGEIEALERDDVKLARNGSAGRTAMACAGSMR